MNIAIIGHGNVGGTLARRWAEIGHHVTIGSRNPESPATLEKMNQYSNIRIQNIEDAVDEAEVILIAVPADAVTEVGGKLATVNDKIIIDATNSIKSRPEGYQTGAEALKAITGCPDVVKGFNCTGYENMANPDYNGEGIDMFTAGDSEQGKEVVKQLSQELGFGECYDFGGDDKFQLLEQLAMCWINLAILQGEGRNIAFKVIRKS